LGFYFFECANTSKTHKIKQNLDEILISGNNKFTKQVERALYLIKENDQETYNQIIKYVKGIKQNEKSGIGCL